MLKGVVFHFSYQNSHWCVCPETDRAVIFWDRLEGDFAVSTVPGPEWFSVQGSHTTGRRVFWVIYCKFWLKQSEKWQNWSPCPWVSARLICKGNLRFMKSLGFMVFPKATPSGETLDHPEQWRAIIVNLFWKQPVKHTGFHLCFWAYIINFLGNIPMDTFRVSNIVLEKVILRGNLSG